VVDERGRGQEDRNIAGRNLVLLVVVVEEGIGVLAVESWLAELSLEVVDQLLGGWLVSMD
jgi:hypothetical protein